MTHMILQLLAIGSEVLVCKHGEGHEVHGVSFCVCVCVCVCARVIGVCGVQEGSPYAECSGIGLCKALEDVSSKEAAASVHYLNCLLHTSLATPFGLRHG